MEQATIVRVDGAATSAVARVEDRANDPGAGERTVELDSLRGLAVLMVLVFHANEAWLPWGWAGVDLFFVLSGYLITSIISRDGAAPGFLRRFYVRRGLRTWPIYYLLIGFLILASPLLASRFDWRALPFVLTYTQNVAGMWSVAGSRFSGYLAHTWTLAVEEQFYLVWPLLVLGVRRRWLPSLAILCVCGSVLARSRGVWFQSLISQADGLALGGWLAATRLDSRAVGAGTGEPGRWKSLLPVIAAVSLLGVVQWGVGVRTGNGLRTHPGLVVLAFNLFWLSVLNRVLDRAGRPELRWLRIQALARLGTISYGVYLYHYPLVRLAHELSDAFGLWLYVEECRLVGCLVTIPVAVVSWRYIERPLLALKSRFAYAEASERVERDTVSEVNSWVDRVGPRSSGWKRMRERVQ